MTDMTQNFSCPNCEGKRGWMVMSGNNKPATQCDQCGHLVIESLTPRPRILMPKNTTCNLSDFDDFCYTHKVYHEKEKAKPKPAFTFKPGDIVKCTETYKSAVFRNYHYMVAGYCADSGLLNVINLRTMTPIPGAFSSVRFQAATPQEVDALIPLARRQGWEWLKRIEAGLKKAMKQEFKKINAEAKAAPTWTKPVITKVTRPFKKPFPSTAFNTWPTHPADAALLLNEVKDVS